MKAHTVVLGLSLAILVVSAPASALADRGHHQGWHRGHRVVDRGHKFHHMHHHQRHFHRPYQAFRYPSLAYPKPYLYGGGYYGGTGYYTPPVIYGSLPAYDPPVIYNAPPAYSMSVAVAPVAPPPPRPSVVEYPTGRYELRGDGFSMPYTWVWIPNPPPPAEAPEPEPRSAPSPPPNSAEAPTPRKSQLYRWVDAQGVVHLTDNPENVPEPYRKPAAPTRPF